MKMNYKQLIILLLLSVIIVLGSLKFGVFWDSVLFVSKMGNPLFDHGILNWESIPVESDPGHPPFLATLMAAGWTLFGKSLAVSHLMMLPFVFGLLWQLFIFVSVFVKDRKLQILAYILVVADPTLLSQLVLVNFEVIQLFFFFVALNAVLKNNRPLKIIGLAFLGIVSFRGMMLCAGVFLIDMLICIFDKKNNFKSFFTKQLLIEYVIAATPAVLYLVWRLAVKGWIISNPLELWGSAWQFTSFQEFLKNFLRNVIVLGHQVTDFGRLVPILFILAALIIKRKIIKWKHIRPIMIIMVFSTIIICVISLLINNAMGHRYYLPVYLAIGLLAFLLLQEFKAKKVIYIGLVASLVSGHFIVYPDKFAQGWDASLAHIPYWELRRNAIDYFDDNQLPISETASFFPNNTAIDNIDLNGDMRSFAQFTGKEKYVFYSNVYNLSDNEFDALHQNYTTIKTFEERNVRIEIMQKSE
jgi:hypothetical protein